MILSHAIAKVLMAGALFVPALQALPSRPPAWDDWEFIQDHWFARIRLSTCPDLGSEELKTHWDYDYVGLIASGLSETEALQEDCTLFKRERNPTALGTRLVRHAFHDAAGGFNGFVNVWDLEENSGLFATQKVLNDDYASLQVPNGGGTSIPVSEVMSLADFAAWACHAALIFSVDMERNQNTPDITGPPIPVRYGRVSYVYDLYDDQDFGPAENFPAGLGPQGDGPMLTEYFLEEFGFTPEETVTIMGAHTLGGARREDSGFHGVWTQSKNNFNNDYQLQVRRPVPLVCTVPEDARIIEYLSVAEDDRDNIEGLQICKEQYEGRCEGWEQHMRPGVDGNPPRFQWLHSCLEDGSGCINLMLNIDIGLYRNLEGFICTNEDEQIGTNGTLNRPCMEGMIRDYPTKADGTKCDQATSRVLATCFDLNDNTSAFLEDDADDMASWIAEFGPLFDRLITHKLAGGLQASELGLLEPPAPCFDDSEWSYAGRNGVLKPCRWVGVDSSTRCMLMNDKGVTATEACPVTCGSCP